MKPMYVEKLSLNKSLVKSNMIYANPAEKCVENSTVKRFTINPVKSKCFRRI